jgi:hypothetical protein
MKNTFIGTVIFLVLIITLGLYLAPIIKYIETFENQDLKTPGTYPVSVDKAILNTFPRIGKNEVSKNNSSDIWKDYPVFSVSSYKQLTNNLLHVDNPDEGTCSRAEFCGAVYHDRKKQSNEIFPLPEAKEGPGARVGYYRTEPNNLFFSIPTNENILY